MIPDADLLVQPIVAPDYDAWPVSMWRDLLHIARCMQPNALLNELQHNPWLMTIRSWRDEVSALCCSPVLLEKDLQKYAVYNRQW